LNGFSFSIFIEAVITSLTAITRLFIATNLRYYCSMNKVFSFFLLLFSAWAQADYAARLSAAQLRCEAVPAMESHSGLLFNPKGYRSYYGRSACYQRLAVDFRQPEFCKMVWRRFSVFASSWGYSEENCISLFEQAALDDAESIAVIRDAYLRGPVRLIDAVLRKNGNRRDFDLLPAFTAGYASSYLLTFYIVNNQGDKVQIAEQGFSLGEAAPEISLYIKQEDIISRLAGFDEHQQYEMLFELRLMLPLGRGGAVWPLQWVDSFWPETERVQRLTLKQSVKAWRPIRLD